MPLRIVKLIEVCFTYLIPTFPCVISSLFSESLSSYFFFRVDANSNINVNCKAFSVQEGLSLFKM